MNAPQDLALSIFGAHVRKPGQKAWSGGLVTLMGDFGFSVEAARTALNRLVARGMIDRHREGRQIYYFVSAEGQEYLAEGDRRFFTFGKTQQRADGWTIVWNSLPESSRQERSRLATRLRFYGFGPIQDATWIAVGDREPEVLRTIQAWEIERYVAMFVGRLSRRIDPTSMIATAWNLPRVAEHYELFLRDFGNLADPAQRAVLDDTGAFVARTQMVHRFRSFPTIDPELPEALAPEVYQLRVRAVSLFDTVYDALEEAAERRFTLVAGGL
ncbi:PaaX family transcriptional regulator C-terminal domain-containing protein [Nocardia beijingensis]|uniref:PaaX family transcriptional regulator n=1 Tax=Nocardia beijingensis TaxID=95162 RepID=UPI0033EF6F94